jgi:Spy/CpxP family protein refolding chaperone
MKRILPIQALAMLALILGVASSPLQAAPATKSSDSTADLTNALKTMRPISVSLLEQDEVQTELKLTDDQKKAIADLMTSARDEFKAVLQQPVALPVAGPGGVAVKAFMPKSIKYDTDKMAAALKPDQLVRLRQLELHLKGPHAFADRRVARVLNLTAEQDLKIEEITMRYEPAHTETMMTVRLNNLDAKPLAELGDKYVAECLKLLTKEQKASWDWLVSKRPDAGQWAKAHLPMPFGVGGMVAPGIAIQGGAIRVAPPPPAAPPAPPPLPPKK